MSLVLTDVKEAHSDHPQDPKYLKEIDGITYVCTANGRPKFHLDGSPILEGGQWQCKHTNNRSHYRCTVPTVMGYTVCQKHGAGSPLAGRPGGLTKKTGSRYSSPRMAKEIRERYERLHGDPELLNISKEISMMDVRIEQLSERLPSEDQVSMDLEAIVEAVEAAKVAQATSDKPLMVTALGILFTSIDSVAAERRQWAELVKLMDRRTVMAEREIRRRKTIHTLIPVEQVQALLSDLRDIIWDEIKDVTQRNRIVERLRRQSGNTI